MTGEKLAADLRRADEWQARYLDCVRDWAALCDLAGVEGDSSVGEVYEAIRAAALDAPAHPEPLDVERLARAKADQPQCSKCGHASVLHNGPELLCRAVFRGAWGPCTCPGYVPLLREASEPEGEK